MRFDHGGRLTPPSSSIWELETLTAGESYGGVLKQIPCDQKEHPIFQCFFGWENPDIYVSFLLGMVYISCSVQKKTLEIEIQSVFARDHYEEFPG